MVDLSTIGWALAVGGVIVFIIDMYRRIYMMRHFPEVYKSDQAGEDENYVAEKEAEAEELVDDFKFWE